MSTPTRSLIAFSLAALLAGCGAGQSVLSVTVSSEAPIAGLATLQLQIMNGGKTATPAPISATTLPLSIGLSFDKSVRGATHIVVTALDASSNQLATGTVDTDVEPSQATSVMVTLHVANVSGDMAMPAAAGDMAMNASADGDAATALPDAPSPDIQFSADSSADLTAPDLASVDLSVPDLESADLSVPDLAMASDLATPDLSMPDLGMPDLATPDLAMRDLAMPDLAPKPDLGAPFGTLSFLVAPAYGAGAAANAIAAGDLNGDGKADLIAAIPTGILVMSGLGGGKFATMNPVAAGAPVAVATGDFNGDNALDAIVANPVSGNLIVLLGDGNFGFSDQKTAASPNSTALAIADLNGDKVLDVVSVGQAGGTIDVLIGVGDGTFAPVKHYGLGGGLPNAVAVADFNGDAKLDLAAVSNLANITLFFGVGDGTFKPAMAGPPGTGQVLATADFNGDKVADLAVGTDKVTILLGDGKGGFIAGASYPIAGGAKELVSADFDGDGKADLAAVGPIATVLYGKGDGSFPQIAPLAAGDAPTGLVAADLDGNGTADLAVANGKSSSVSVILGRGGRTLDAATASLTGHPTTIVTAARLEPKVDANLDLLVRFALTPTGFAGCTAHKCMGGYTQCFEGCFSCSGLAAVFGQLHGIGDGTFGAAATPLTVGVSGGQAPPPAASVGDLNGDGVPDFSLSLLPLVCSATAALDGAIANGDGTYGMVKSVNAFQGMLAVGDLNGDNKGDAVVAGGDATGIATYLGLGDGTFGARAYADATFIATTAPVLAELDGDNFPNVVVGTSAPGVAVLTGAGMGKLNAATKSPLAAAPNELVLADVTGDGQPDLVVATANGVAVLPGFPNGTFGNATYSAAGTNVTHLVVADFNGDKVNDVAYRATGAIGVLVNKGNGTFLSPKVFPTGFGLLDFTAGDFTGDGKPDLAASFAAGVAVLVNVSP